MLSRLRPRVAVPIAGALVAALGVLASGCSGEEERLREPPVWLDTLRCIVEAQKHLITKTELERAKALSMRATSAITEQDAVVAYAELTAGAVEKARGDLAAWTRHMKKVLELVPPDQVAVDTAMEVARQQKALGDLDGARETLNQWRDKVKDREDAAELERTIDAAAKDIEPPPEPPDDGMDPDDIYPVVLED